MADDTVLTFSNKDIQKLLTDTSKRYLREYDVALQKEVSKLDIREFHSEADYTHRVLSILNLALPCTISFLYAAKSTFSYKVTTLSKINLTGVRFDKKGKGTYLAHVEAERDVLGEQDSIFNHISKEVPLESQVDLKGEQGIHHGVRIKAVFILYLESISMDKYVESAELIVYE